MRPVLELIARVGPSEANVLITGENGTGKGTVAQALHAVSGRTGKGLVTVNAGGLSEGVFESELFGHVKGAFTDAQDRPRRALRARRRRHAVPRRDRQRAAQPAAEAAARARDGRLRARRVVADAPRQRAHRLGDQRRASPTRSAAGRFRQDLLFRLNTIEIALPPLRDRREDIPALAAHFLRQHAQRYRKALDRLRAGGAAGAARSSVAGQHPRARSRGRARRADGAGRRHPPRRTRAADRSRLDVARRGHEPRGSRRLPRSRRRWRASTAT